MKSISLTANIIMLISFIRAKQRVNNGPARYTYTQAHHHPADHLRAEKTIYGLRLIYGLERLFTG